jgi:hypothetical protein
LEGLFLLVGRLAGAVGVLIVVAAVAARLVGHYWLGGMQVGTFLQAGIAAMLVGCLGFLAALTAGRARGGR